ncbi:hypothetical protein Tsubulata_016744 [Turnera subulata]|uniref:J domain-containing protein n=1 Tax=Turnera subulata TaxID=218843 RepID=A0A9Q0GAG7_9ROSI|nr:hypothetical protein Tsubulata_016744 [Turnera subulata]
MDTGVDHYSVLGLPSGEVGARLTEKEITRAYKLKALEVHPDKRPHDPNAHADFQRLQSSYESLMNPVSRRRFDNSLRTKRMTLWSSVMEQLTEILNEINLLKRDFNLLKRDFNHLKRKFWGNLHSYCDSVASSKRRKEGAAVARQKDKRTERRAGGEKKPPPWLKKKRTERRARTARAGREEEAAATEEKKGTVSPSPSGGGGGDGINDLEKILEVSWEEGSNYCKQELSNFFSRFGVVKNIGMSGFCRENKKSATVSLLLQMGLLLPHQSKLASFLLLFLSPNISGTEYTLIDFCDFMIFFLLPIW